MASITTALQNLVDAIADAFRADTVEHVNPETHHPADW